jgi:protein phosphatase
MRYFESYGNPSDNIQNGDINVMQYIFLGDFCDRGNQSLEIILLLFALKIKYPDFIYLIRGHHEDIKINEFYGLGDECTEKLKEDIKDENSIFKKINGVFDHLPFGVLVDNTILCIHGGIGASIDSLDDINNIPRPVHVSQNPKRFFQMNILDLLYSEYNEDEDDNNLYSVNKLRDINERGFFVTYGKKRLDEFMNKNNINLIIAAHKFVKEGFCTFCDDKLLNLFSCSNYLDKENNVGAMIIIGKKAKNKNANIMPKLIGVNENKNKNERFKRDKNPSPFKIK